MWCSPDPSQCAFMCPATYRPHSTCMHCMHVHDSDTSPHDSHEASGGGISTSSLPPGPGDVSTTTTAVRGRPRGARRGGRRTCTTWGGLGPRGSPGDVGRGGGGVRADSGGGQAQSPRRHTILVTSPTHRILAVCGQSDFGSTHAASAPAISAWILYYPLQPDFTSGGSLWPQPKPKGLKGACAC